MADVIKVNDLKADKKEDKKGRSKKLLLILLLMILLSGISFTVVYFNLFGAKTYVDSLLKKTPFGSKSKTTSQKVDLEKMYNEKISALQDQNKALEEELKSLQTENDNLKKQLLDVTTRLNDMVSQQTNTQNKAKEFSAYIQGMDAKKAAKIIEGLIDTDVNMANEVLKSLSSEIASEILSNISADKTIKLLGISNKAGSSLSTDISGIVDIYKNMDSKIAATIFESMISDNQKYRLMLNILKNLDSKTSSQIISNMKAANAAKVTQDLSALK